MNAVSLDGRFVPLTVTDRLTRRAAGLRRRARARLAERARRPTARSRRRGPRPRRSAFANGPTYTQIRLGPDGPRVVEVAARLGGGHDAELCRAALGVDLNDLAVSFALGERPSDTVSQALPGVGGACVLFLVAPEGTLRAVDGRRGGGGARRGSSGCASTGGRGGASGRCGAAPTAPERSSPSATTATTPSRGLAVRRRPYASWSMRTRRSTRLGFQPPAIGEEEIAAVAETLRSGWLTTGPRAALLEERMAAYLEAEHVLAVASGTAALHLALLALGVGPGDEVITSPITWPATANVIEHCGATPVFCDVRDGDLNLDPAAAPGARHRADEGDPARCTSPGSRATSIRSSRSASRSSRTRHTRPRAATAGARSAASPTPPASRSTRRRTSPPARAASSRRTATDVAEAIRNMRLDAPRRRVALRPGRARLQGQPLRRARRDRARPARPASRSTRASASGSSRSTTTGSPASRASTPLARDPRDAHAHHLYVVRIDAGSAGGDPRRLPARARRRADRDEHPLPAGAPADLVPRALPGAGAAARRRARRRRGAVAAALARPLRRRHPRRRRRRPPRARALHRMRAPRVPRLSHVRRPLRIAIGVTLTTLALAYILWKIDIPQDVGRAHGGRAPGGSCSPSRS